MTTKLTFDRNPESRYMCIHIECHGRYWSWNSLKNWLLFSLFFNLWTITSILSSLYFKDSTKVLGNPQKEAHYPTFDGLTFLLQMYRRENIIFRGETCKF